MNLTLSHPQPKRRIFGITVGMLFALLLYMLLFTRFGVFLIFDLAGDISGSDTTPSTYKDAPISVSHVLSDPIEHRLPARIEQVSGLIVEQERLVFATDQTELFFWPKGTGSRVSGGSIFPLTPLLLKQGGIETVAKVDGTYWLAGDQGEALLFDANGDKLGSVPLPSELSAFEITGMAQVGTEVVFSLGDETNIAVFDPVTQTLREIAIDFSSQIDATRSDGTLSWSGVASYEGHLYLSAETYPIVVVVDFTSGKVTAVLGGDGTHGFSDVAVFDGTIYLPRDHNYFDERPPILAYSNPV